jgi:hypothetical protein
MVGEKLPTIAEELSDIADPRRFQGSTKLRTVARSKQPAR